MRGMETWLMAREDGLRLPLLPRLTLVIAVFLAAASAAIFSATDRPWMGLTLAAGDDGLVTLQAVLRDDLPAEMGPGQRVNFIESNNSGRLELAARDLIEEPDTLPTYADLNAFLQRQTTLSALVGERQVTISGTLADGQGYQVQFSAYDYRPIWSLPLEFWLQLGVAGAGILLGGWVWALRREEASAYFALSGAGLMVSAASAAIYSTRELALNGEFFRSLSALNVLGTNTFGLALISLLLVYPNRLVRGWVIPAVWAVGIGAVLAHLLQLMPSQAVGSYAPMLAEFAALFVLVGVQLYLSRTNPLARAALGWFGLSILLGTAMFVFAIATPVVLGFEPQAKQAHAFAIILLIYAGLAVGVARYRLFDLGLWAFRLGSYLLGGVLLIALDALLIYVLALDRAPAFGLSLLAVAMLYLPLRNFLASALIRRAGVDPARFRQIVDIAMIRDKDSQASQWRTLLDDAFAPLAMAPDKDAAPARLLDGGQGLLVPAAGALPAMTLRHANGGRRLFSHADVRRAEELTDLMRHAQDSRDAHDRGVREERSRIARDLHDNIGAQLLRILHSVDSQRKDVIVGETLADLRDIISHAQGQGMNLGEILAELRFETDERLNQAGIALTWRTDRAEEQVVDAQMAHTLRSIIREASSNVIRHSRASKMLVDLTCVDGHFEVVVADNGIGLDTNRRATGNGLTNIAARAERHGGSVTVDSADGTRLTVRLPVEDHQP